MKERNPSADRGHLSIGLLGAPTVFIDGAEATKRILRKKALALLSFLLVESSRPHLRKDIALLLWPDLPEERADHSLRQTLYSLRKLFDGARDGIRAIPGDSAPHFLVDRQRIRIAPGGSLEVDIAFLASPPSPCTSFHPPDRCPHCFRSLSDGISRIRGPFMEGFDLPECDDFRDWKTAVQERLQAQALSAVDLLSRIHEREGRFSEGISVVSRYLKMDPLDESAHRRLMELHAKLGDRRAVELQYEICRNFLRQELGVDPEKKTRELLEKIRLLPLAPKPKSEPEASVETPSDQLSQLLPERIPVTVLFFECLDGHGFEEAEIPPSEMERILSSAMNRVRSLGGVPFLSHVNAFLAYFGVDEQRREGAARKAARAALELATSCSSDKKTGYRGGIHSGMAIVLPATSRSVDPTGAISRPAISLCMQADPGTFLLSEDASSLLRGQFLLEPAGLFRVVGGIFPASRLVARSEPEAPLPGESPQVGREEEMSLFRDILGEKERRTLLVSGEPGIGKSRLVAAFVRVARVPEGRLHPVICLPHFTDSPLYPLIHFLRRKAGISEDMEREMAYTRLLLTMRHLGAKDPERAVIVMSPLMSLSPHPDFPPLPDVESSRKEVVEDILCAALGHHLSTRKFLIVEDLHWADDSTQRVLRKFLGRMEEGGDGLVILTGRSMEIPPWVSDLPGLSRMELSPLSEEESRNLVLTMAAGRNLPEEIVLGIVRNAEGIPLFLEELTRTLLEQVPVAESKMDDGQIRIPGTLSEVLYDRLSRLAPEVRMLLQKASVIGRSVPMYLFRNLAGCPIPRLETLLEEASRAGLIRRNSSLPEDSFDFHHVMTQEAIYQSLVRSERRLLHHRVASILEEKFPNRAETLPGVLGKHWMAAEEIGKAIAWFEKGARSCLSGASYIEAERHCRIALELVARLSDEMRDRRGELRLLILLGNALVERLGFGSVEASEVFRQAFVTCMHEKIFPEETFPAFFGLWHSSLGSVGLEKSGALADTIGRIADQTESVVNRSVALYVEGCVSFWKGDFSRSLDRLNACRDSYTRARLGGERWSGAISFEEILSMNLSYRPWVLWFLGRFVSARRELEIVLDQARVSEGLQKKGLLLSFSCIGFRYFRLPDRVVEVAEELERHVRLTRAEGWAPVAQAFRGWALAMKKNPAGIPLIIKSLLLCRRANRMLESSHLSLLAEAYLALEDGQRAIRVAESALRVSCRAGTKFYDAELWRIKGDAFLLQGDIEEAHRSYSRSIEIGREQGARALKLRTSTSLVKLLVSQGRNDEALLTLTSHGDMLFGAEADQSLPDLREAADLRRRLLGRNVILHPLGHLSLAGNCGIDRVHGTAQHRRVTAERRDQGSISGSGWPTL